MGNTYIIAFPPHHREIAEEIHKSLEYAYMALRLICLMPYQRYVLALNATFIIGVADFVASGNISKGYAEIVLSPQFIVYLATEHLPDLHVDIP